MMPSRGQSFTCLALAAVLIACASPKGSPLQGGTPPGTVASAAPSPVLATPVPSVAPSPTPTRVPPTPTAVPPTMTPSPVPTPSPALGDTVVREADDMVIVYVPAGEFEMGSDAAQVDYAVEICNLFVRNCRREWFSDQQPAHPVALDAFWLDRTEVTNGQYARCVAAGRCNAPQATRSYTRPAYYGSLLYDEYPVLYVNWTDASAYCAWAGARLPTEAEWEYAARGPQGLRYPWGDGFRGTLLNYCDANCPIRNWRDAGTCDGYADTAPVGTYLGGASWCGALDLAGNVWEFVADYYGPYASERQVNPVGPAAGEFRVVRGGAWDHEPCDALSAYRTWFRPDRPIGEWDTVVGFRCARSQAP